MNNWLNNDRLSGLIVLFSSLVLFFFIIPAGVETNAGCPAAGLSPAFMPKLIALIMGFLSFLMVIKSGTKESLSRQRMFSRNMLVTVLIFILYIILVPRLGYLVSSIIFLPVILVFFGTRSWVIILPLSIILPVLLYWFFSRVMFVMLPEGLLI